MRRICGRGSASLVTFIAIACISLIPEESWILCSQHTTQEPPLHIFALEIEASSAWISQSSTRLLLYFPVPANNSGIKWRAPPTEGSKTARSDLEVAGGAAPEIKIRPLIGGGGCGSSVSGKILSWSVRVAVDGQDVGSCSACSCEVLARLAPGPHAVSARVHDSAGRVFARRLELLHVSVPDSVCESGTAIAGCCAGSECHVGDPRGAAHLSWQGGARGVAALAAGSGIPAEVAERSERALAEYAKLHRRILDPDDQSVAKRFLVVRSSHGLSNTQIEEVTGLLMAMVTDRALILDFSNDTYTGPRPVMEYDWPLNVLVDGMAPFLDPPGASPGAPPIEVVDAPRLALEEYGKYGGLLACADWRAALAAPAVVLHTLFGLPTAYLSRRHAPYVRETFGPYAFPLLHAFLHRPAAAVRAVAGALHAEHLAGAGCSVGLQIRWHHLRAYLAPDERGRPHATVAKFLRCAGELCPLHSPSTVIFVATDFRYIHKVVREVAAAEALRRASEATPNLARLCGGGASAETRACETRQSSTSAGGEAARANDGDRSGVFAQGSCTHTWDDEGQSGVGTADPWWEVDLFRSRAVAAAVLHNRADCCGERLSGVTVRVGDSPAPGHGGNAVCAREVSVPQGRSLVAVCENGALHGRYLTVERPGERKILTICEVEVLGESAEAVAVRNGSVAKVVHLDARREVVSGDTIMDGGDHETAYADQLLLASCDHILTTKESTLGFVAHASVLKPTFQISAHEQECVAIPHSQSGLVQEDALIHDEWPWSRKKFNKLPCADEFQDLLELHNRDVLAPV